MAGHISCLLTCNKELSCKMIKYTEDTFFAHKSEAFAITKRRKGGPQPRSATFSG